MEGLNRAYEEMLKPARKRLRGRKPEEIEQNTGIYYDREDGVFRVGVLGEMHEITYPEYACKDRMDEWAHLVLLHYMDLADGTPVPAELIAFGGMKDGLVRGTNFDRTVEQEMRRFLRGKEPQDLLRICEELGAEIVKGNADLCAVLHFLPYVPVTMKIWYADDEFEAAGKLLLPASADHFLTIEDAVTLGELVLRRLHLAEVRREAR